MSWQLTESRPGVYDFFAKDVINTLALLPTVPGIVLAVTFLRTYPERGGSAFGLIIGYALLKSPFVVLTVRSSFQSMNLQQIDLGFTKLALDGMAAPEGEVTVVIRPEGSTVGEGPIDAEITDIYYVGETIQSTVRLPDGQELPIELDKSMSGLGENDTVAIGLDTSEMHVLSE